MDLEMGAKITGSGFPLYRGKGARLQRALIAFFLDEATAAGYEEVIPPHMVNEASAYGTGQLPDKDGQMYYVTEDDLYLIPTAEVPVTATLGKACNWLTKNSLKPQAQRLSKRLRRLMLCAIAVMISSGMDVMIRH